MPRYFTSTKSYLNQLRKRKATSDKNKGRTIILGLIVISLIFSLGLFYLVQVNGVVTKGYQIRNHEKNLEKLQAKNQKLKIEVAELQSMHNLKESIEGLNMVEVAGVSFLTGGGSVVAK